MSERWYPGKIFNRFLRKTSENGEPGIIKLPAPIPSGDYKYLYEMQDKLIEHKYPTVGVTELMISHAGDIYREMTVHSDFGPHLSYIYEKWGRLEKYIRQGYISCREYEEEFKRQIESQDYRGKVLRYYVNLESLIKETEKVKDKPFRDVLLACLDMIKGLIIWYETNYENIPTKQFELLTEKIGHFFPEWNEQ